ncbi:peroxiredoxin [Neolewinella xylanilytica]|uniref:Peroxiredoxin n=1 Tax=Neolewinella xylanilytica TaxID=1514080 RepID=A0A2S6I9R1_9BACT|nr:thioredoxin-like domain-containing protein [Neolewinella xylanilytica]PPK88240.1 peroxiredoxin [Neolewinella xylanilytica]
MKRFLFLLTFLSFGLTAQQSPTLTAEVSGCATPPQLYAFTGFGFVPVHQLDRAADGVYTASLELKEPVFRYLGTEPKDLRPLIIGGEQPARITGNCGDFRNASVSDSPVNEAYDRLKKRFEEFDERYQTLQQDIEVIQDERVREEGRIAMAEMDREKELLVNELKNQFPILGRIASLNTYLSHYSADLDQFPTQLEHYLETYFQFVDYSDPGFNDLAWTYEAYRTFGNQILRVIPTDQLAPLLLEKTGKWPVGSRARFLARSGALAAMLPERHPATQPLADSIAAEFADLYPAAVASMKQQTDVLRTYIIGAEAPDFTALTPSGDSLSLESLRGQVVLLDFWASWCGPCRRENPNVVRMYNKFKGAGFEILGVSLDDNRARWEQAIADDELEWLHVSDLMGWRSAYGQLYGVTSIPQTVLLDRKGNILARNLRGPELERKLAEVLGVK